MCGHRLEEFAQTVEQVVTLDLSQMMSKAKKNMRNTAKGGFIANELQSAYANWED